MDGGRSSWPLLLSVPPLLAEQSSVPVGGPSEATPRLECKESFRLPTH